MLGEIVDDVVGNEAADDAFLVLGFESDQLHRPLDAGGVDDGLDHIPDGENASRQDVVGPRSQSDLAIQSPSRFLTAAAPILVSALRRRHLVVSFPQGLRRVREN